MNLAASLFLCDIMIQNDLNLKILMPVCLFSLLLILLYGLCRKSMVLIQHMDLILFSVSMLLVKCSSYVLSIENCLHCVHKICITCSLNGKVPANHSQANMIKIIAAIKHPIRVWPSACT